MKSAAQEPIAIIGIGCRFPGGASDPDSFWRLLRDETDVVVEVPPDRWDINALYDSNAEAPGKIYTRFGYYLGEPDRFDARFFNTSPREAAGIDPQQRLFLEVCWEALEHAGQPADRLAGSSTGVFAGVLSNDYSARSGASFDPGRIDAYYITGNEFSFLAGRVSYFLGLQGPSMVVTTACSSSLVSVHLACQSLRAGECDMALAGGINLMLSPDISIFLSRAKALSAESQCRPFDAAANGIVRGEGSGVVVLKRLSDAIEGEDNILAVIRGSGVSHDGASCGLTVPNGLAQQAVIRRALSNAAVDPVEVSYVEAHGTGTPLGDPIEVAALAAVYGQGRDKSSPLLIGSVKSNIGHLESAAGIAGLIKVVLSLQHGEVPRHLHFKQPNPRIPWDKFAVAIPVERIAWPPGEKRRIAGVSSFGLSGTNAHVIVEEAPPLAQRRSSGERASQILAISAKDENALLELAGRYEDYFQTHPHSSLEDVCFTANAGRSHFRHRLAVVAGSPAQARRKLASLAARLSSGRHQGRRPGASSPKIAFLFTGQGSQHFGMGRVLYEAQPVFREALDRCDALLRPYLEHSLLSVLHREPETASLLSRTAYGQPALFAFEYALARMWRSWGVEPSFLLGHSLGEYVAACVAGVFSLEEGLKLVAQRGKLMDELPPDGKMIVVFADEEKVSSAIAGYPGKVSIAAINASSVIVISGESEAVQAVATQLRAENVKTRALPGSCAFHSPLMEPVADAFEQAAAEVKYSAPQIKLISNVSGRLAGESPVCDASYWRRHMRETVRFSEGVESLRKQGCDLFLELGPAPVLAGMMKHAFPDDSCKSIPTLRKSENDWEQTLEALRSLYCEGAEINWQEVFRGRRCRKVALPTYPFQRARHWYSPVRNGAINSRPQATQIGRAAGPHPLLSRRLRSPFMAFESDINLTSHAFLADHRIQGVPVVPGTVYLEMALAAATVASGKGFPVLRDVFIENALPLPDDGAQTVQLILTPEGSEDFSFRIFSLTAREADDQTQWKLHARGKVRTGREQDSGLSNRQYLLHEIQNRCAEEISKETYYRDFCPPGCDYGPLFRGIEQIWRRDGEALGRISLPREVVKEASSYRFHPSLSDACFQLFNAALPHAVRRGLNEEMYLPIGLETFRLHHDPGLRLWGHFVLRPVEHTSEELLTADLILLDDSGRVTAEIAGLLFKRTALAALPGFNKSNIDDWFYEIEWLPETRSRRSSFDLLPGRLASPSELASRLEKHASRLEEQHGLKLYDESIPHFNALCSGYIIRALQQMGCRFTSGQRASASALANKLGVLASYHRLFERFLEILAEDGILEDGLPDPPAIDDLQERQQMLLSMYPALSAELSLLGQCGPRLSEILRGKIDPLDILFQDGSIELAEKLYQESPLARVLNSIIRDAIRIALEELPEDRKIRILEIGAGTGATASYVLPVLQADKTEYIFTDVSQLFIYKARQKFNKYSNVTYKILNIEEDARAQGFDAHGFDLIIAANVLHATPELRRALMSARGLLKPGGLLLLMEATEPQRWLDLVFGLTEGWWKFKDKELRPSYPLLPVSRWLSLLKETGFTDTAVIPEPNSGSKTLSQQTVIIAQAPLEKETAGLVSETLSRQGAWVIFCDTKGIGASLADRLKRRGDTCALVFRGESFERIDNDCFRINPAKREHFELLFRQCLPSGKDKFTRIVHMWSLDIEPARAMNAEALKAASMIGCGSALHLIQELITSESPGRSRVWMVTGGAQSLNTGTQVEPAQSLLWGFGRVVAMEHREIWGGLIDLDPAGEMEAQASSLLEHILSPSEEDQIAFRGNIKYAARLVHSKGARSGERRAAFRPDGAYLITGGLGGLGLEAARWMAEQGTRQIVLAGRSGPSKKARDILDGLQRSNVRIETVQADVSRKDDALRLIEQARKGGHPIRGIIHAAGVLDDGVMLNQSWERFARVLEPKQEGAWNLHDLTRNEPLEFFIMFSSASSLLGPPGQANHAAANAFLDALAHYRRAQGLPGLSINWGAWSEVGAASQPGRSERLTYRGLESISPEQGMRAFARLFDQDIAQAGVINFNLNQWRKSYPQADDSPFLYKLRREPSGRRAANARYNGARYNGARYNGDTGLTRAAVLAATPEDRLILVKEYLCKEISERLGLPASALTPDQTFSTIGLDSLMALEVKSRIETDLGVSVSPVQFIQNPTVDLIAGAVLARLTATATPDSQELTRAQYFLGKIDELSDEEVDLLLRETLNSSTS